MPVSGGKIEITDRIAYFPDTGKVMPAKAAKRSAANISDITEDTKIEENFVCSEKHSIGILEDKKTLEEAIKCWKYKKQIQGHNRYERTDLIAIE